MSQILTFTAICFIASLIAYLIRTTIKEDQRRQRMQALLKEASPDVRKAYADAELTR